MFWKIEQILHLFVLWSPETSEATAPVNAQWPDIEEICKLLFDLNPRDPKFRTTSPVYTERMRKVSKGQQKHRQRGQRVYCVI